MHHVAAAGGVMTWMSMSGRAVHWTRQDTSAGLERGFPDTVDAAAAEGATAHHMPQVFPLTILVV